MLLFLTILVNSVCNGVFCIVSILQKCTGVRNRAGMVQKRNYGEETLMSDFTLLEEAGRVVDAADRTLASVSNGKGVPPSMMKRLTAEAAKRDIRLRFMPVGFARHARNTSQVKSAPKARAIAAGLMGSQMLFWHIDIYFAGNTTNANQLVKFDSCAEDSTIDTIVQGALQTFRKRNRRRRIDINSSERGTAVLYEDCQPSSLAVFLQNEQVLSSLSSEHTRPPIANGDADMHRYIPLNQTLTLLQVLSGRAVVEFPVLYIAIKGSAEANRLATASFGLFEKPEPESSSESSESDSSSDSENEEASGKRKHDQTENQDGAETPNGSYCCESSQQNGLDLKRRKTIAHSALPSAAEAASSGDCRRNSPELAKGASSGHVGQNAQPQQETMTAVSKDMGHVSEGRYTKGSSQPPAGGDRKVSRWDSAETNMKGNARDDKMHAQFRHAPTETPATSNTSEKAFDISPPQNTAEQDCKSNRRSEFDTRSHPSTLFEVSLPEGRVPRKPKATVV